MLRSQRFAHVVIDNAPGQTALGAKLAANVNLAVFAIFIFHVNIAVEQIANATANYNGYQLNLVSHSKAKQGR